jgi:hypothetical protein
MSCNPEQPRGCTGETCKAGGTYVSERGARQYVEEGEAFPNCPVSGQDTTWLRTS